MPLGKFIGFFTNDNQNQYIKLELFFKSTKENI